MQEDGVSVFEEVLKVVRSCFWSVMMYGKCLQTLLWLVVTGMRDVVQYASFLLI